MGSGSLALSPAPPPPHPPHQPTPTRPAPTAARSPLLRLASISCMSELEQEHEILSHERMVIRMKGLREGAARRGDR